MSKNLKNCLEPYTRDEINKKILKESGSRPQYELLDYNNKYRDENMKMYETKKRQFLDTAKKYQEMNRLALLNNKVKLESAYEALNYDFLEEIPEEDILDDLKCANTGCLLRKRTERSINTVTEMNSGIICMTEPWFKRFLILNRFICTARRIIYKNRLLTNLSILGQLNEEKIRGYETNRKRCHNVSYPDLFDKYL